MVQTRLHKHSLSKKEQAVSSVASRASVRDPINEFQEVYGSRAGSAAFRQQIGSDFSRSGQNQPPIQAKPSFRGLSHALAPIQAKLTVGPANDRYEQEADRVARQVVERIHAPVSNSSTQGSSVQRRQEQDELQKKAIAPIQGKEMSEGGEVSSDLESEINRARGGGQPLGSELRLKMGEAMGADFGGVRVHTDERADGLNQRVGARAFTTGQDLFFKRGEYEPGSRGGQELIAHELTHVVQQGYRTVIRRFLDEGDKWKENGIKPIGVYGRNRKQKGGGHYIETSPNKGGPWTRWKESAAETTEKSTPSATKKEVIPLKPITDYKPYNEQELIESSWEKIISYLNSVEVMALRQVSVMHKKLADDLIWKLTQVYGMSSFQGSMSSQIQKAIQVGTNRLKIAADQVNIQEVENILGKNSYLKKIVQINYGQSKTGKFEDRNKQNRIDPNKVKERQGPTDDRTSKMHNKFIVQGKATVMTGSPNLTASGLGNNIESMVYIKNPLVAAYFNHYFNLISDRAQKSSPKGKEFAATVKRFNAEENKIRLAMEPFMEIRNFVKAELQGADQVIVRMFVISVYGNHNVVDALCDLARAGIPVTVVLDKGQYKAQTYVNQAARQLLTAEAQVVLQQTQKGNIMHDKMILAHFPKTDKESEKHRVMVGSSGFTKNVYEGMNYENMIAVDDKALYDYFMNKHHLVSWEQPINTTLQR